MKIENIPDHDHLVRYVSPSRLMRDEDGTVIGILYTAFLLRDGESYLSTSCVEIAGSTKEEGLKAIRAFHEDKFNGTKNAALATGNVGVIKEACKPASRVRVTHEPEEWNPAHAAVRRFPSDHIEILEKLAAEAWSDWRFLRDV